MRRAAAGRGLLRLAAATLVVAGVPFAHTVADPPVGGVPPATRGDCFEANGSAGCDWAPCEAVVCDILPECCDTRWDALCAEAATELCDAPPLCHGAEGDCFTVRRSGGCADESCCFLVCRLDGFCCDGPWDHYCVAIAEEMCIGRPSCLVAREGAQPSPERCGTPTNDGCAIDPPMFEPIELGQRRLGAIWANGRRDVDWYELDLAAPATLAIEVQAELPVEVVLAHGECADGFQVEAYGFAETCEAFELRRTVPAGRWWICVAPGFESTGIFAGLPCDEADVPPWEPPVGTAYVLRVLAAP